LRIAHSTRTVLAFRKGLDVSFDVAPAKQVHLGRRPAPRVLPLVPNPTASHRSGSGVPRRFAAHE
jgi:hypothetical protein